MGKTLPERFLKADPTCPCETCDKIRKTCRYCEQCKDCCDCPICTFCGGAEGDVAEWFIKEVGSQCHCEPCKGCGKFIDSTNPYGIDDDQSIWCDKCGPKHFKEV